MNPIVSYSLTALTLIATTWGGHLAGKNLVITLPPEPTMTTLGALLGVFLVSVCWIFSYINSLKDLIHSDLRTERRRKLIRWRKYLGSLESNVDIEKSVEYSEMRNLISKRSRDMIEGSNITVRIERGGNIVIASLLDDLTELETNWNLI